MATKRRWDPCVAHSGDEVDFFVGDYFADKRKEVFLVGGAGFDPRSCMIASLLAKTGVPTKALLFRENRPNPPQRQVQEAEANVGTLSNLFERAAVVPISIFGADNAVVGGRNATRVIDGQDLGGTTDIVVDTSAMSIGTGFPIIRYLRERIHRSRERTINLHVFVSHDPALDARIRAVPSDAPSYVHGFKGESTLDSAAQAAKLWMPLLATGRQTALERLHAFIEPHDTCPILPFPSSDPRRGDTLAEEYLAELESTWSVDTRNVVYADESDPLDLYRTILRLDDLRKSVFAETGGSLLVLSPLGSKVMALGALMAALERDLPVAHLEPIGYELDTSVPTVPAKPHLVHVWLEGDAYPSQPPMPSPSNLAI